MYKTYIKRAVDFIFSLTALLIFLPLGLILATLIKLDSKGPVIFSHLRYGKNKMPFKIYKFRSMSVDAPRNAPTNNLRDAASHITRVGKVMRKLSLDEIPQLINVLRGEMSIIGPRPVILKENDLIAERDKYGANECRPGITGWAQVNGRDELHIKDKARMDGEYAHHLSLYMDLKCLLRTLSVVFLVKGHREGHEVTDKYDAPSYLSK